MNQSIIDCHSHYMPDEIAQNTTFFKVNWSDIERQVKCMDAQGIEKALLLYPTSDAHINLGGWKKVCDLYNESIAKVVSLYKGRFIGAGILPVDAPENLTQELKRLEALNLRVISLPSSYEGKYLDDESFFPIYEFARKKERVIHVHPQILNPIGFERIQDPLLSPVLEYMFDLSICIGKMMMSGTFRKFPEVKFIFAHYGGVIPFLKERFDNTYAMLRSREYVKDLGGSPSAFFRNLYFDTSGSKSLASMQCALEIVDADHILFGSDFPVNQSIADSIKMIAKSYLTEVQKGAILRNSILADL